MNPKTDAYITTIGIECHTQLKTRTKLFAAVEVSDQNSKPNQHISQICLGMPGALPVLNKRAVQQSIKVAFAFNTKPQKFSKFDRKHYFYPDLPKGYQITQYDQPIIVGGHVDINIGGNQKRINITRAHIEEDAGKTIHPSGKNYSLVDLNRAGVPLLEIVSEPELHTPEEARVFAKELYLIMKYADVSEADLSQGNMRFDVNVSVSKDSSSLGTRTETKNLNSFRSVEKAVEYETKRQIELLNRGGKIVQETRGWDDAKQKTFPQRSKEEAEDYRYFPEPDVPPLELSEEFIDEANSEVLIMPNDLRHKLSQLGLDNSAVETLVDEIEAGLFINGLFGNTDNKYLKRIANWLASDVQGLVAEGDISWAEVKLDREAFIKLASATLSEKISSTSAKLILFEMIKSGGDPLEIAEAKQLLQVSDEKYVRDLVKDAIESNQPAVLAYRSGNQGAIGFLVGKVMEASKGKANPQIAQKIIRELLK